MRRRVWFASLIVPAALGLVLLGRSAPPGRTLGSAVAGAAVRDRVIRVVDGDTVVLATLDRVRLIGVNTPERGEPGYQEATDFTGSVCLGRWVEAEPCPVTPRDRYGRLRALVYLRDDHGERRSLSEELIRRGLGVPLSIQPCHIDDDYWYGLGDEPGGNPGEEGAR